MKYNIAITLLAAAASVDALAIPNAEPQTPHPSPINPSFAPHYHGKPADTTTAKRDAEAGWCNDWINQSCWKRDVEFEQKRDTRAIARHVEKRDPQAWCQFWVGQACWKRDSEAEQKA